MSNKEQKKAKVVKNMHTAFDKLGKLGRKILPAAITSILVTIFLGNKGGSNKA